MIPAGAQGGCFYGRIDQLLKALLQQDGDKEVAMRDNRDTQQKLTERSCVDFAAALAAKQSVPGGGGAAALTGALGAALCSMVAHYTVGKKAYASVQDDIERILIEAEDVRENLMGLINADAEAFEPLARAYSIPKSDPARARTIELATKTACSAPIEMMRQCARAVPLLEELAEKGSRLLLSDVLCGAALCGAALVASSANVYVNTGTLGDREFAEGLEAEADSLIGEYAPRAQAVVDAMRAHLRRG